MENVYIAVILDKSGSMSSVKDDAIGGFNQFLMEQQGQHSGYFRLTLFDTNVKDAYSGKLKNMLPLTEDTYRPGGMTALLDAIGRTIVEIGNELSAMEEVVRPKNIVIAILTDGEENSSREHSKEAMKNMIMHQQEKYSWNFVFLAANMDAIGEAVKLGIEPTGAFSFVADRGGTRSAYQTMSKIVTDSLNDN